MINKMYIGTNLKMYKNIGETKFYLENLMKNIEWVNWQKLNLFVLPSYTSLAIAKKTVNDIIQIGAQNMCHEDKGPFTGEISPLMLKEIGINMVMIGHCERRTIFREDNILINKKVNKAMENNFTTLLCVGETLNEKDNNISEEVIAIQIKSALKGIDIIKLKNLIIAYEPVWSIGDGGIPASQEYVLKIHSFIKKQLNNMFGEVGKYIPVIYGGSVNKQNAKELICVPGVDGLFIGRSAWEAENFIEIIKNILPLF